jgi:putative membrane protein
VNAAELNQLILSSGCFSGASIAGWIVDPAVIGPLGLGLLLYLAGVLRLWRSAGPGRGASYRDVALFGLGWSVMALALVSPLHEVSERLFAAHMAEHELVMAVAAPLLVLCRPLGVLLWAFPQRWRRRVGSGTGLAAYLLGWDIWSRPLVATFIHAVAIWVWHIPALFDAAVGNEAIHWLQHMSFFVTAMFFWWSLLSVRQRAGVAIAELFATAMHTGALGVLIATARQPMYPAQAAVARAFGVDPLSDQQLAGLIMWIPGGTAYVIVGLALAGLWITRSSRQTDGHVAGA